MKIKICKIGLKLAQIAHDSLELVQIHKKIFKPKAFFFVLLLETTHNNDNYVMY